MGKMGIIIKLHKISKKLDRNPELEKKMEDFLKNNNLDFNNPECLNMKTARLFIKEFERVSKNG
jgi:hypothetical protein